MSRNRDFVERKSKRRGVVIGKPSNLSSSRREFLFNVLPAGSLFCLGCGNLSAWTAAQEAQKAGERKHKFQEDSGMSFQEVFEFGFKHFIQTMESFARQMGRDNLLEMIRKHSEESARLRAKKTVERLQKNDFATFKAMYKEKPGRFGEHILTIVITEESDTALADRVTECLYAKTFRDRAAADIGYAWSCHGDFAWAQALNPKLRLIRDKTLMNGDEYCNFRWVWEG
jgi:hypothetical protein